MKQPLVSILIPVYNRENLIGECIESALAQTYTHIEVVVVDNASTDETWAICQQFAAKDQRVRVFRNDTNIGPVRNWLRCLDKAQGEYGKILFSDDLMFEHFLERTLPFLDDSRVGFVLTAALIGTALKNGVVAYSHSGKEGRLSSECYFELLLASKVPYSPGAAVFRIPDMRANLRLSFPTYMPWDFTKNGAGPDVLLYALTASSYKCVAMLSTAEVFFRVHSDSFTIANSDNGVTKGYQAALGWFFANNLNKKYWAKYIARSWLTEIRRTRRLVPLSRYCLEHEGKGGFIEASVVMIMAIRIATFALLNSPYKGSISHEE